MKAIWKDVVIAESDATVIVEGNHYFPPAAIRAEHFQPSDTHTVLSVEGHGELLRRERRSEQGRRVVLPGDAAKNIENCVAFWKGVKVSE